MSKQHLLERSTVRKALFGSSHSPTLAALDVPFDTDGLDGSIIDIETTGLSPSHDAIITCGILSQNKVRIFQLLNEDYATFKETISGEVKSSPDPRWAYCCGFERGFLGGEWNDLGVTYEVDWDEYNPVRYYKLNAVAPMSWSGDISGAYMPTLWSNYLNSDPNGLNRPSCLFEIVWHNAVDLLREFSVWQRGRTTKPSKYESEIF